MGKTPLKTFVLTGLLAAQGCTVHFMGVPVMTSPMEECETQESTCKRKPRERDYRLKSPILFGIFLAAGVAMASYQVYRLTDFADRVSEEF